MTIEHKRMQLLRGSTAQWLDDDMVLLDGEMAVERAGSGARLKLGDGVRPYDLLPYIIPAPAMTSLGSINAVTTAPPAGAVEGDFWINSGTGAVLAGWGAPVAGLAVVPGDQLLFTTDDVWNLVPVGSALSGYVTEADLASPSGGALVGFVQTGTGAVERTAQDKMREGVSVKDFGAKGDGTTDDTAAIQLALNVGGEVILPSGCTYKISAPLSITKGTHLRSGIDGAKLVTTSATANMINITGPTPASGGAGVTIEGLTFLTIPVRTGGSAIQVSNGVYNVDIVNCRFERQYIGVRNTGTPGFGFYVRNCIFYYSNLGSILIDNDANPANNNSGAVEMILENLNILGPGNGLVEPSYGVKVECAGDITLKHVSTVKSGAGLWIGPTTGKRVQLIVVDGCFFDSGANWGVFCVTNGGRIDCLKITDTWSATAAGGGGYYLGTSTAEPYTGSEIRQVTFVNCVGANCNQQGFRIGPNAVNVTLIGCSASQNSEEGILVDAKTNSFKIIGCTCGPAGEMAGNIKQGIRVAAGTSDGYIIAMNSLSGNGGVNITDGGTGATKFVVNNI